VSVCGILVAAGSGRRLHAGRNKALLPLMHEPLFCHALRRLRPHCDTIILVVKEEERADFTEALARAHLDAEFFAPGGQERRHSVENALKLLPEDADLVLVHDAARPFPSAALIRGVIGAAREKGAAVPALPVSDTLRRQEEGRTVTLPREGIFLAQTPQGFRRDVLLQAYALHPDSLTDDAGLVELMGRPVALTPGEARNFKITREEDFLMAEGLLAGALRTGTGYDAHRLVKGRALVLGGVHIPHELGLLGHSDADAALHALTDALLGACALGDIGRHFPDSDRAYKGISSLLLLQKTREILAENGFIPRQADLTIIAQRPKLAPFIDEMRGNIARALRLPLDRVSVKATTTEGLGFEGREEGISAQAVALAADMNEPGTAKGEA
jgi:2-C-methyl-D-erythritol 4-phosphate cytidylyltransferase/2-C-methyl-D-erythritol 2,4-cyclodiphosphate synthase